MNTKALDIVRHAVCAVGYIKVPLQEHVTAPEQTSLYVIGTGFLINPRQVLSCAHVMKERGTRRMARGLTISVEPVRSSPLLAVLQ